MSVRFLFNIRFTLFERWVISKLCKTLDFHIKYCVEYIFSIFRGQFNIFTLCHQTITYFVSALRHITTELTWTRAYLFFWQLLPNSCIIFTCRRMLGNSIEWQIPISSLIVISTTLLSIFSFYNPFFFSLYVYSVIQSFVLSIHLARASIYLHYWTQKISSNNPFTFLWQSA